jgi:hypothetical protein
MNRIYMSLLGLEQVNFDLMQQNEVLRKSNEGLILALSKQNSDRRYLERQVQEQAGHIHLLWSMVIEPDDPVWPWHVSAFAVGFMAAMVLVSVLL